MTRIYEQRGFIGRQWLSMVILAGSFLYGFWELWLAATQPEAGNNNAIFGVLFIGASIFGLVRLMKDSGDIVASLDRDGSGRLVASLWRPWGRLTVAGPQAQFTNWRFYIAVAKRNQATPLIRVDHAGYPRPLTIELKPDTVISDGLREVAGEAVADFEERRKPRSA
jgi:hypothetical protein